MQKILFFEEPPPRHRGSERKEYLSSGDMKLLRENPGKWARMRDEGTKKSYSKVQKLRKLYPGFEFTSRVVGANKRAYWVRFISEENQ